MPKDSISKVADQIIKAMAYNRTTYKNKAAEHVGGAYIEFYKATLARKNGHTKWTTHWMTEVRTLLERNLYAALVHPSRGFKDKRKALNEIFNEMRDRDQSYRRIAEHTVKKDFGIAKLKIPLDDADTEAFWERVQTSVDVALKSQER